MSILTKTIEAFAALEALGNAEIKLNAAIEEKFPDAKIEVEVDEYNGVAIAINDTQFIFVDEAFESVKNPSDPTEAEQEILEVLNV